jgi:hypothetical protein
MPVSAARADETLNDTLRGGATPHVLVHIGNPGAAGTGNVAQDDGSAVARKPVTFAAPENHPSNIERRVLSSAVAEWTGEQIDAAQEITHISVWSAVSSGQVEFIHALPAAVTVGSDGVKIESGDLEHAIQVYAKP